MTRTGPADVVMLAYHRTVPGWPVPARPGSHEPGSGWVGCRESAFCRDRTPRFGFFPEPAHSRFARRSGRLWPSCPSQPQRAHTARPPAPAMSASARAGTSALLVPARAACNTNLWMLI